MAQFQLPQSPEQLAFAQEKSANASYQQYLPTSSAIGANFSSGTIVIPFSLSQPQWWTPAKSFVRLLINTSLPAGANAANPAVVGTASGSPFLQYQGIAPAYFQAASLFSRIEFLVNGVTVSLLSDWCPQVHAFMERTLRPGANMDTFQYSKDFTSAEFHDRQSRVTLPSLELGVNDNQLTGLSLSIYDIGVAYPAVGASVIATINAAGTTVLITASVADAPGLAAVANYIRANDVLTILDSATQQPRFRAYIRDVVVTSVTVLTITTGCGAGATGANYDVGAIDNPAQVFIERQNQRQITNTYELLWKPPIAAWQGEHAIPGGSFCELRLTPWPQSVFQARAVESIQPGQVAGRDFQVTIQDLSLQLYTQSGPRCESLNFLWGLDFDTMCQAQSITVGPNSLQQLNFDIPSSTYYIGIAIQNRNLNDSAISSTKFTVGTLAGNPTDLQNSITRLFIQWKGQSLPPQRQELFYKPFERDQDPTINPPTAAGNDQLAMRFVESQLNNGLAFSSCERESDWLDRGPLYSFFVPSDVSAQSTRLQVNLQFSRDLSQVANVLVFAISRKVASITMDSGRYTSVVVQDL
jgi:hypothetical protein